jgi:uncharacterized membrane protein
VMFLGDIIIGALWKVPADRTRNVGVILWAQRRVGCIDKWVLIPSIFVMVLSGIVVGQLAGIPMSNPTYLAGQFTFAASGVVWRGVLQPTQKAQLAMLEGLTADATVPEAFQALADKWFKFGLVAIAFPLASLILMVLV